LLALLYDVHGNASALEAVLADAQRSWRALDEARRMLRWDEIEWLYSLPTRIEDDGVLYVHGSPLADSHSPNGTTLVNPGSVGQPLDGDPRAAYALVDGNQFEQRRIDYDHVTTAASLRALGSWAEPFADRRARA